MSLKLPALTDDISDIGEKAMISRHRRIILEQLGLNRDEIPNNAKDQVMMLKAYSAENRELYVKLYDLYVRGIGEDGETLRQKAETVDNLKKQVMEEIRAYSENKINNMKETVEDFHNKSIDAVSQSHKNFKYTLEESIAKSTSQLNSLQNHIKENISFLIDEQLNKVRKINHVIEVANKPQVDLGEKILPEEFEQIMQLAANRINILLVGPSGCGKSHISEIVAEALGLNFYGQSCSAGMSESIFSGWLLPIGDSGKFTYVESPFVKAYENGGVFLFDEIDGADGNTLLFLNQALANDKFFLPQRFDNPVVKKHKDFVAVAAANTFGAGADSLYNSRNALDAASMDRFRMGTVKMDYSAKVEEKLVDKKILDIGREIREVIKNKNLRKILTTRFLIDATTMKKAGWTERKLFESYAQDWSIEEKKQLNNIFQKIEQKNLKVQVDEEIEPKKINQGDRILPPKIGERDKLLEVLFASLTGR